MAKVVFKFYPTYNYGGDHDVIIDKLKTNLEKKGVPVHRLAEISQVKKPTYDRWFDGRVISPRHATVAAAFGALGLVLEPLEPDELVQLRKNRHGKR